MTTKTPLHRFKQHVALAPNGKGILAKALLKYGDEVVLTALLEGSEEYCLLIENKLRPVARTGWNTVPGGGKPPVKDTPHTAEAKAKISESSLRSAYSPAQIAHRATLVGVKRPPHVIKLMRGAQDYSQPWTCPRSNNEVWAVADKLFLKWNGELEAGRIRGSKYLEKQFSRNRGSLGAVVEKFAKQGWNPQNDPKWVEWASQNKLN